MTSLLPVLWFNICFKLGIWFLKSEADRTVE